jgi:hypothetical protein
MQTIRNEDTAHTAELAFFARKNPLKTTSCEGITIPPTTTT